VVKRTFDVKKYVEEVEVVTQNKIKVVPKVSAPVEFWEEKLKENVV
jgi:hypothetical protein